MTMRIVGWAGAACLRRSSSIQGTCTSCATYACKILPVVLVPGDQDVRQKTFVY
eukprot:COSAG05_NODE_3500_length_2025_cov_1451.142783_1_plen_54_part_00